MKKRNPFILSIMTGAQLLCATAVMAATGSFTGTYTNNFDSLGTAGTAMPTGFRTVLQSGANSTYTAAAPITTNAIAAAVASGTQTLTPWATGTAVTSSGTSLFNCGSTGNNADRALGSDPTGIAYMGIELSLSNNTGSSLSGVTFYYSCKCLTNGTSGTGTESAELPGYSFFYSLVGNTTASNWFKVSSLSIGNYTQGTVSNSGPVTINFPAPLTNNGVMYFRWADDNCQTISPDQMIAIDNVGIIGASASGPQVSITTPTNGSNFTPGSNISVTATASETSGTITNVALYYAGTNLLGNLTNSPYTLTWSNVAAGSYALTAIAADAGGIKATSSVVNVTVSYAPPAVSITVPSSGASFTAPTNIPLLASVTNGSGNVTNVSFYIGTNLIAVSTNSPFTNNWAGAGVGTYSLTAVATDDLGSVTTSAVRTVTVLTPVSVTITSPESGSGFSSGSDIVIQTATSNLNDEPVTAVSFYSGTTFLGIPQ